VDYYTVLLYCVDYFGVIDARFLVMGMLGLFGYDYLSNYDVIIFYLIDSCI